MKKIFFTAAIVFLSIFAHASTDTCAVHQISAVQIRENNPRTVYLIMDKDGGWYLSYEPKMEEKLSAIINTVTPIRK